MRKLHRDIGFLMVGFIIVYSVSGIVLTYRTTNFMKHDIVVERTLSPGLDPAALGMELRVRDLQVNETRGDTIFFNNGSYNVSTGIAMITVKDVVSPVNKFINIHKSANNSPKHLVNIVVGVMLLFLAISSFWMFKRGSKMFRRIIILSVIGIIIAFLITFLQLR